MFYLLAHYFPGLNIHASTQLSTHNEGQIHFLGKLSASRVNLAHELSLNEIQSLTITAHENNLLIEVFVHGSYCLSFSGICYLSSVHGGNSGNRGRCSQPCRDRYLTTAAGKDFPLNIKDNSAIHRAELYGGVTEASLDRAKRELYDLKTEIINTVRSKIEPLSSAKAPLILTVSGQAGTPLKVSVRTPESSFSVLSGSALVNAGIDQKNRASSSHGLNYEGILKRLKALNETEYFIKQIDLEDLHNNLFIPFKELTSIKKQILFILNGSSEYAETVEVPIQTRNLILSRCEKNNMASVMSITSQGVVSKFEYHKEVCRSTSISKAAAKRALV